MLQMNLYLLNVKFAHIMGKPQTEASGAYQAVAEFPA